MRRISPEYTRLLCDCADSSPACLTCALLCLRPPQLRVRVGIHTGVNHATEVQYNSASNRYTFGGRSLALCKAVCDAGHGGLVLMSQESFSRLSNDLINGSSSKVRKHQQGWAFRSEQGAMVHGWRMSQES